MTTKEELDKFAKETEIDKIYQDIYTAYGSESGFLFGIEPKHKEAVKAIIKLVWELKTPKK